MIEITKIRQRLSETIKQSGKTQTELAKLINIGQSNISHYIKGDKLPALDTFANLCLILDVDPAYILCIKDY